METPPGSATVRPPAPPMLAPGAEESGGRLRLLQAVFSRSQLPAPVNELMIDQ